MNNPTERQISFIKGICRVLNIEFTGRTKQDAYLFITNNVDAYYQKLEQERIDDQIYFDILHEDAGDRM